MNMGKTPVKTTPSRRATRRVSLRSDSVRPVTANLDALCEKRRVHTGAELGRGGAWQGGAGAGAGQSGAGLTHLRWVLVGLGGVRWGRVGQAIWALLTKTVKSVLG